jgi:hypothetical protein
LGLSRSILKDRDGHPRRELGIPRLFRNRLEARLVLGFKPDRLTGKNTKQLIL